MIIHISSLNIFPEENYPSSQNVLIVSPLRGKVSKEIYASIPLERIASILKLFTILTGFKNNPQPYPY